MRKYYFSKEKYMEAEDLTERDVEALVWPEYCDGKEVNMIENAFFPGDVTGFSDGYLIEKSWCIVRDDTDETDSEDQSDAVMACASNAAPAGNAVLHPSHYCRNGHECIDIIRAVLTEEEFRGYCKGNCIKYIFRCEAKGGEEDIRKAIQYLRFLLGEDGLQAASGEREVAGA